MSNKDRMTDHQEPQAHETNKDNSQTIPLGSVGQTHSNRPIRTYSKTIGKKQTHTSHTHTQNKQLKH